MNIAFCEKALIKMCAHVHPTQTYPYGKAWEHVLIAAESARTLLHSQNEGTEEVNGNACTSNDLISTHDSIVGANCRWKRETADFGWMPLSIFDQNWHSFRMYWFLTNQHFRMETRLRTFFQPALDQRISEILTDDGYNVIPVGSTARQCRT